MKFVKEHFFGIILGIVVYELYYRSQNKGASGP